MYGIWGIQKDAPSSLFFLLGDKKEGRDASFFHGRKREEGRTSGGACVFLIIKGYDVENKYHMGFGF